MATRQRDGLGLVLKAIEFAAHKHRDQRRKDPDKTPYINHPIALAQVLRDEGRVRDPVVIAAESSRRIDRSLRGPLAAGDFGRGTAYQPRTLKPATEQLLLNDDVVSGPAVEDVETRTAD